MWMHKWRYFAALGSGVYVRDLTGRVYPAGIHELSWRYRRNHNGDRGYDDIPTLL